MLKVWPKTVNTNWADEMTPETDFIDTVVRLMQLTREGKLAWEKQKARPSLHGQSGYRAEIGGISFSLEDAGFNLAERMREYHYTGETESSYRMVIEDENGRLTSPPLRAVSDLVALIQRREKDVLQSINKKLDAELQ